jgi:hypothetical protein
VPAGPQALKGSAEQASKHTRLEGDTSFTIGDHSTGPIAAANFKVEETTTNPRSHLPTIPAQIDSKEKLMKSVGFSGNRETHGYE